MPTDLLTEPARPGKQLASAARWERIGYGIHNATATTLQVDMPIANPRRIDSLIIRINLIRSPGTLNVHASFGTVLFCDRRSTGSFALVGQALETNRSAGYANAGGTYTGGFSTSFNAWVTLPGFRCEVRIDAPYTGTFARGSNLSVATNVSVRHVNGSSVAGILTATMDGNKRG